MELKHTTEQIDLTIARASKISFDKNTYMKSKLNILIDLRSKMDNPSKPLTGPQVNFFNSLMATFSDESLSREESWSTEWNNNPEIRERADVVSKYYIAQKGWFMEVARDIQRIFDNADLDLAPPDWSMTERMMYNDYAEKVWINHKSPHRWAPGELVCCRSNARTDGWGYYNRTEGINVQKDPCMVIESGSKPISNATKYDEKRGGCRWVSINPIGSDRIFHVMEKDLKVYRQPKKKGKKK
jgi:hypothetical protein